MVSLADLIRKQIGKADSIGRNRTVIEVMDNGVFRAYSNGAVILRKQVTKYDSPVNLGAGDGVQGIELQVPKIPFKYWLMTLDYYKDVHKRDGTEVSVLFYHNVNGLTIPEELRNGNEGGIIEDGNLLVYCPRQRNTPTHSDFKGDALCDWLEQNYQCIVETHSHHVMEAFFSGTDDANEKQPRCYGVYGKINTHDKFLLRFYLAGEHIMIKPSDLFDMPVMKKQVLESVGYYDGNNFVSLHEDTTETDYTGVYPNNHTYPETWLDRTASVGGGFSGGVSIYFGKQAKVSDLDTVDYSVVDEEEEDSSMIDAFYVEDVDRECDDYGFIGDFASDIKGFEEFSDEERQAFKELYADCNLYQVLNKYYLVVDNEDRYCLTENMYRKCKDLLPRIYDNGRTPASVAADLSENVQPIVL